MFSRLSPQNSAFNMALALVVASLAWTTATTSSQAQSSSPAVSGQVNPQAGKQQTGKPSNSASVASNAQGSKPPSPVLAATPKRATTDWWVPGILGGSVVVGGVALGLMLRRSTQALVTEPPDPIRYNPDPTPSAKSTDLKASQTPTAALPSEPKSPPASEVTSTPEVQNSESLKPKKVKSKPEAKQPEAKKAEAIPPETDTPESSKSENQSETVAIAHGPTTRMPRVSVMDVLVHDLRSSDPAKRQKAIWELGRRGDSRAVQPLVDLLVDSDSRQRSLVLSALSEISTRTLKPMSRALAISMQDENADVRKNAIRDLTRIYDTLTNISQLLHSACEDPDPEVQETAKWAIGQINRIKSPMIQGAGRSVSLPESLN
jgi:HEAT repeats